MISAANTLSTIEQAMYKVRQDEENLHRVVEAATEEMTRLRAEQAELYRALAKIRMQALRDDQILGTLDDAERRALAAIERQKQRLADLENRQKKLLATLQERRARREELAAAVTAAADAIATRTEATQRRVADEVEWQALSAKVDSLEAQAAAADEKATQSEADRDAKSKPYHDDPLFMYLWNSGYGTSAYRGGPIARMGDNFVARVVQYEQARQNYYALTEIPKRLRAHAERLKEDVAAAEAELVAYERRALEQDGIAALEQAHEQAVAALEGHDREVAELEEELASLDRERAALMDDTSEQGLGGAVAELAAALQRDDLRVLLREAMETPTPEDERIVQKLQVIATHLDQLQAEADQARHTMLMLAKRRAELERASQDFRRSGYERGGGTFVNDKLIGDIIGGIIGGVLSSKELRDALRSGYRPSSGSSRPARRSSGSVFGGSRGGFGGGFGGGGGSRGGGGGGFRTGGGF